MQISYRGYSSNKDRLLRSHTKPLDWKLCLFCQDPRSNKKKKKTSNAEFDSVNKQIMDNAKFIHEVFVRVVNVVDLYAAEACYQNVCLQKLKKKKKRDVKRTETGIWQRSCIWVVKCLGKVLGNGKCHSDWEATFLPRIVVYLYGDTNPIIKWGAWLHCPTKWCTQWEMNPICAQRLRLCSSFKTNRHWRHWWYCYTHI